MRIQYAIVSVSDMPRAVAFYRDVLGMELKFESPGWTEFATDGTTLALHATGESAIEPDDALRPGRCRPGLRVANLDAFHRKMVENGVRCIQEPSEAFGARVAQYLDPDGLTISVSGPR